MEYCFFPKMKFGDLSLGVTTLESSNREEKQSCPKHHTNSCDKKDKPSYYIWEQIFIKLDDSPFVILKHLVAGGGGLLSHLAFSSLRTRDDGSSAA